MRFLIFSFICAFSNLSYACVEPNEIRGASLDDLLALALCLNPSLQASRAIVGQARADIKIARADSLPQINASLGMTTQREKYRYTSKESYSNNSTPSQAQLSGRWIIYDFGKRDSFVKSYKALYESAHYLDQATIQEILLNVSTRYYALISAKNDLAAYVSYRDQARANYEKATSKFQIGAGIKSDYLLFRAIYNRAELQVIRAENDLALSKGDLNYTVGLQPYLDFDIEAPVDSAPLSPQGIRTVIAEALNNNPEILGLKFKVKAAREAYLSSKKELYPEVYLVGSIGASEAADSSGTQYKYSSNMIGIELNIPIFDGFRKSATFGRKLEDSRLAVAELEVATNRLTSEVWTYYNSVASASGEQKITRKMASEAKEAYETALRKYEAGATSISEMTNAQTEYLNARLLSGSSFFKRYSAELALKNRLGILAKSTLR
jgi:outer membrane protein